MHLSPKSNSLNVIAATGVIFLTLAVASCSSKDPVSPTVDKASLAYQVGQLVSSSHIPGAAGILFSHTGVIDLQAAGVRKAGDPTELTKADLLQIGSLTKFMTATMIGKLIDEGLLSWTSKPSDVIKDLAGAQDSGYANITLLDLLRHRAGIPSDEDFDSIPSLSGTLMQQRLDATIMVLERPPAVTPGTYRYSNMGYVIAASMAEVVTGQDWQTLMNTKLFQPLGITAFFGWPTEHDANEPWGHELVNNTFHPVEPSVETEALDFGEPAGGISMTLEDYSKFARLHMDAIQGNPRILSAASFQMLRTPEGDYACGIMVAQTADGVLYWHNGSNTYFYMVLYLMPTRDLAISVAINAGDESLFTPVGLAAEAVLEKLLEH